MGRVLTIGVVLAGAISARSCSETSTGTTSGSRGSTSSGPSGAERDTGTKDPSYVYDDGSGSGATWKDLYADFFGPSGRAGCAGAGNACHAEGSATGAARSSFVCANESSCRESLLGKSNLVQSKDSAKPEYAFLIGVLRKKKPDGSVGGTQPTSPLFVFHANSIDRIKTWIGNGAGP